MKRKIIEQLYKWKNAKSGRMPLLLYGARQVGKTYAVKEFGKTQYKNTVHINFEKMPESHYFFSGSLDCAKIIKQLGEFTRTDIIPEDTLIIFDEIQNCERALTSLKYFSEDAPDYHIIAAGSLLGVAMNRPHSSFPVGKVYMETLYPMDFEEFLLANNETILLEMIAEHFRTQKQMPEIWHNKAMDCYRNYIITGGMPAAVKHYIDSGKSTDSVCDIQDLITKSYINDMAKYAHAGETIKIIACYESIPAQLAKDNKKFQYKVVKKGGSANLFGESLQWLISSGVVLKCDKTQGLIPPSIYADPSSFKIYLSDIGLLSNRNNITLSQLLSDDRLFTGGLAENYVACQLVSSGRKLFYWQSDNLAEVDFLIQDEIGIIPVEVKANLHSKSKSLDVYRKKYSPPFSIRISAKNFGYANNIKSIPLYAAYLV